MAATLLFVWLRTTILKHSQEPKGKTILFFRVVLLARFSFLLIVLNKVRWWRSWIQVCCQLVLTLTSYTLCLKLSPPLNDVFVDWITFYFTYTYTRALTHTHEMRKHLCWTGGKTINRPPEGIIASYPRHRNDTPTSCWRLAIFSLPRCPTCNIKTTCVPHLTHSLVEGCNVSHAGTYRGGWM